MISSKIDFKTPFVMQKKTELKRLKNQVCTSIFIAHSQGIRFLPRFAKASPTSIDMRIIGQLM